MNYQFPLSPSQLYNRIAELEEKEELGYITREEEEELEELAYAYSEESMDYDMDFFI